jgi:hypothetical protein
MNSPLIPLSAPQRGGVRTYILERSPSLRSREGEILSGAKEGGEFMRIKKEEELYIEKKLYNRL